MSFQSNMHPADPLASVPLPPVPNEVEEEATLITLLRAWGISYLTGGLPTLSPAEPPTDRAAPALLRRLARCSNARVRDATIALLLLHPELAEAMSSALQQGSPQEAETLAVLTLATLYLQRFWWDRLTLALGRAPAVPEEPFAALWRERQLPHPAAFCGRWGLLALEHAEQQRTGVPLTYAGDWHNQLHHLLLQEEAKHHPAPTLSLLAEQRRDLCGDYPEERTLAMSM